MRGVLMITRGLLLGALIVIALGFPSMAGPAPKPKPTSNNPSDYEVGSWAGVAVPYPAYFGVQVTDVKGTFTVPDVNCGLLPNPVGQTASAVLIWVGLAGSDHTVEQAGIIITCNNYTPPLSASAWFEFYPLSAGFISDAPECPGPHPIGPGNIMTLEVSYKGTDMVGTSLFEFALTNTTAKWKCTISKASPYLPNPELNWAFWGVEPLKDLNLHAWVPLAPFGTITFSSTSAEIGTLLGPPESWPFIDYEICDNAPALGSVTGPTTWAVPVNGSLNAKGGFSIKWGTQSVNLLQGPAGATTLVPCK